MDEFVQFLFVIAIIAVGIVQQYRKEARKKKAEQPPIPPVTSTSWPPEPEETDETYGGYIPAAPEPETAPKPAPKPFIEPAVHKTAPQPPQRKQAVATPPVNNVPATPTGATEDYGIHSVEEARRAIIWSEILNRKTI